MTTVMACNRLIILKKKSSYKKFHRLWTISMVVKRTVATNATSTQTKSVFKDTE